MKWSRIVQIILYFGVWMTSGLCELPAASAYELDCNKLAIITWRGETVAEKGLIDGLRESPHALCIQNYDAKRDVKILETIIESILEQPPDVIYTYGTTVTKQALDKIPHIPVVFNIVNRPVKAGIIKSWENSGNNATGASNQVSVQNQLLTLKKVINFSRLGVVYNPFEQNSVIQRDVVKQLEESLHFTMIDFPIAKNVEATSVIQTLEGAVDAVFVPADTMMVVHGDMLGKKLKEFRLPAMGSLSSMVKEHEILLGLVPDYYQLGQLAAKKILLILAGTRPDQIPSSTLPFFNLLVNLETAREIDIQIPTSLLIMANSIVRE